MRKTTGKLGKYLGISNLEQPGMRGWLRPCTPLLMCSFHFRLYPHPSHCFEISVVILISYPALTTSLFFNSMIQNRTQNCDIHYVIMYYKAVMILQIWLSMYFSTGNKTTTTTTTATANNLVS